MKSVAAQGHRALGRVRSPISESITENYLALRGPREVDVLSYVSLGCRNAEVAERLSLSTETVKA